MTTQPSPRMISPAHEPAVGIYEHKPPLSALVEPRLSRNGHGFTLTEVILVVTTLAIIATLLMPAIGKFRDRSNTVTCLSNLRTLYVAMMAYQHDHDGWFPPGRRVYYDEGVADSLGEPRKSTINWRSHLMPEYIDTDRNFYCPAMEIMDEFKTRYPEKRKRLSSQVGYGIQMWVLQNKMTSMPGPYWDTRYPYPGNSKLLFLADTSSAGIMWAGTHYNLAMDGYPVPGVALKPRSHLFSDALNFMFLDGHAATLRRGTADRLDDDAWKDVFDLHGRNGLYIPAKGKREAEAKTVN